MRILAFDQSTTKTGWAFFEDGSLQNSGVLDFHSISDIGVRSQRLWSGITSVIFKQHPNIIVAEEVSLQNPNVKTIVELARVQGLIQAGCYEYTNRPIVYFYTPSFWRKTVGIQTGRGIKRSELKKASIALVEQRYHRHVSDDEADAILIGQAAVYVLGHGE